MADFFDRVLEKKIDRPYIEGLMKKYGKDELKNLLVKSINGEDIAGTLKSEQEVSGFNTLIRETEKFSQEIGFTDQLSQFFTNINRKDLAGAGQVRLLELETMDMIRNEFKNQIGRNPTAGEISTLLQGIDFSAPFVRAGGQRIYDPYRGIQSGTNREIPVSKPQAPTNFSEYLNSLKKTNNISAGITTKEPIFREITKANLELKKYGEELPSEIISQIIGSASTPESVAEITSSYIKSRGEAKVQEQLAGLPAQEEAAVNELEATLQEQQGRYFSEQLTPRITESLNTRGLLNTGSFATALAKAGQQSYQGVVDVTRPLRSQIKLGAPQRGFDQTLRGALEQGKSLAEATAFARNLLTTNRANSFTASQSELGRLNDLQMAQLGYASRGGSRQPSGLDYFLQYGLPVLGGVAGSFLGPYGTALGTAAGKAAADAAKKD